MKITTFSIVAGSLACQARCPFCVARMTPVNGLTEKEPTVNWRNFCKACRLAQIGEATTVLITSKGEPTLFPEQITKFLEHLQPFDFPIIEMQTNGITIADGKHVTEEHLQRWYDLGLTTIAISIVHYDPAKNHEIYLPYRKPKTSQPLEGATVSDATGTSISEIESLHSAATSVSPGGPAKELSLGARLTAYAAEGESAGYINLPKLIKLLKKPERPFTIRLTCIAANGFIDSPEKLENLLAFAAENQVEQVSLTPVAKPFDSKDKQAFDWVGKHYLKAEQRRAIEDFLSTHGQVVRMLPHGATVYDIGGQNLNWSNCLTRDQKPDEIRSLIFFPDGHARTNWDLAGSVLF